MRRQSDAPIRPPRCAHQCSLAGCEVMSSVEFRKHSRMDRRLSSIEKAALATIIVSLLVIASVLLPFGQHHEGRSAPRPPLAVR